MKGRRNKQQNDFTGKKRPCYFRVVKAYSECLTNMKTWNRCGPTCLAYENIFARGFFFIIYCVRELSAKKAGVDYVSR